MSQRDEYSPLGPNFEDPAGAWPYAEQHTVPLDELRRQAGEWTEPPMRQSPNAAEMTLPFVDLYQPTESGPGRSPYGDGSAQWTSGYDAVQQPAPAPYPVMHPSQQSGAWGPGPYAMARQEHPQATTVLVFGAVSVAMPVLSFVAWYMGNKAKREIEQGAPYVYSGNLRAGHILGKVIGILTIVGGGLYVLFLVFYLIMIVGLLGF